MMNDNIQLQTGKLNGVSLVGQNVELTIQDLKEKLNNLSVSKKLYEEFVNDLTNTCKRLNAEKVSGKIHLKEAEYAIKWVSKCLNNTKTKLLHCNENIIKIQGAIEVVSGLFKVVISIHDKEENKLNQFKEYEKNPDPKNRPIGYPPPLINLKEL